MRLFRAIAPVCAPVACALAAGLIAGFASTSAAAAGPEKLVVEPYPATPAWKQITNQQGPGGWYHEHIPGKETVSAFSRILTDQSFVAQRGADPAAFIQTVFAGIGNACDGVKVSGPTRQMEGGYPVAYGQIYCGTQHGEKFGVHLFYKVIGGDAALYSISWEDHTPPSADGARLEFPKGQEAQATALLKGEAAANAYLSHDVYVCGGHSTDPRCGK